MYGAEVGTARSNHDAFDYASTVSLVALTARLSVRVVIILETALLSLDIPVVGH